MLLPGFAKPVIPVLAAPKDLRAFVFGMALVIPEPLNLPAPVLPIPTVLLVAGFAKPVIPAPVLNDLPVFIFGIDIPLLPKPENLLLEKPEVNEDFPAVSLLVREPMKLDFVPFMLVPPNFPELNIPEVLPFPSAKTHCALKHITINPTVTIKLILNIPWLLSCILFYLLFSD